MILRAAIVTLLVLNLGIAAWWIAGGNVDPPRHRPALPSQSPGLRLVSEAPAPEPVAGVAAASGPAAAPVAAATDDAHCLRFGPFADAAARDAARAALAASATRLLPRDMPAKPMRGWKVHIPAFATREEAKAMGEKIKAAGISDWYLLNEGVDANGIALGRYGSEDAARRREAELKAKGIPAVAAALGDSAAQWWLDARLRPGVESAALAPIAPARRIDCAALR